MRLSHQLYQAVEAIWWGKKKPPLLLRGLSHVYKLASNYDQKRRVQKSIEAPLPVISIGNITVGGSGKTPFTLWLANELKKCHFKPIILCRGDGAKHTTPQLLDDDSLAKDVGDEAVLLYRMSRCPVISAKDRLAASKIAAEYGDVMILDDGFQYRQLQRCCDILLIADAGMGNDYLLPAGPLREPMSALNRAHIVVRTGSSHKQASLPDSPPPTLATFKEWQWHTFSKPLHDWNQCAQIRPESVIAVSAIARPHRFTKSLQDIGIRIEASHFFPDHYAFTVTDMSDLWQQGSAIAVTAKDAVKLLSIWPKNMPLWVLEQQFEAQDGLFDTILSHLPCVEKHSD
ncbi:MAG: tetraacyldisaccharide 4'-kinase [Mariprofundaceae bacterium]|nr:tetraacyldisaccharide 4'-kinase [Mariprofundaceae bacterium]